MQVNAKKTIPYQVKYLVFMAVILGMYYLGRTSIFGDNSHYLTEAARLLAFLTTLLIVFDKLPAYEADDGDLTNEKIEAIRKAVPQKDCKSVKSLFGEE